MNEVISPFWTVDEASSYCRVHPNTMQALLRAGTIKARRVGRQWRILKRDLDGYLDLDGAPDRESERHHGQGQSIHGR